MQSNFETSVQQDEELSPDKWLYSTDIDQNVSEKISSLENHLSTEIFRPYRYAYQDKILTEIQSELKFDSNGVPCDNVSLSLNFECINSDSKYPVCPKCCSVART